MGHYFIAYSRRDFYFAESLFYALRTKHIDTWIDVWRILPGDNWKDAIAGAIESCQGLILIATKDSLRSPYVRNEIRQACREDNPKPIYLVIRGHISKQDLVIPANHPQDQCNGSIDLSSYAHVIVDMRANFAKGTETLASGIHARGIPRNVIFKEKLPRRFSLKLERILYLPPVIAVLVLFMVITEIATYGIGAIYADQVPQLLAVIRDVAHGSLGESLFLEPLVFGTIASFGALVIVLFFGVNFSRRKRVNDAHFYVLLLGAGLIVGTVLRQDLIASAYDYAENVSNPISVYARPGEYMPSIGHEPIILFVVHGITALFIVILGIVFLVAFLRQKGQGAVLRSLSTGWASERIRRNGNSEWIAKLPDADGLISPAPSYSPPYRSYCVLASPEDGPAANEVRGMLRRKGCLITDTPHDAECLLVILSPFSDISPLQPPMSEDEPKPVIYVVTRSMRIPRDMSVASQWIDYRRPTKDPDQFWKQWGRRLSDLKRGRQVLPYVPETLKNPQLPTVYGGRPILLLLGAIVLASALLVWAVEYSIFVRGAIGGWLLPVSVGLLLGTVSLAGLAVTQMFRDNVSLIVARRWFALAGVLTIAEACTTQSVRMIISFFVAVLVIAVTVIATRRSLRRWLPPMIRKTGRTPNDKSGQRILRPISTYRAITSPAGLIMLLAFLWLNATWTSADIVPYLPQPFASTAAYAVAVPGPYYLAAPGAWSQDANASAFGYHFRYGLDKLEITQDEANGYITWLKFYSVSAAHMRFASHFRSSIHIHFTNSDVRTSVSLGLNDLLSRSLGPLLELAPSGRWRVIKSTLQLQDGQLNPSEVSHDYTLEVEVNGTSCTYRINGNVVTTFTDPSAASVQDIMMSVQSVVPGGMKLSLSEFAYTPMRDPLLGQ